MKTLLKYDIRIRFTSTSNCTLVVAPESIFIVSLAFFFSSLLHVCFIHVYRSWNTVRICICVEQDTVCDAVPSRDRDVAAPRADIARFCYHLWFSPRWPLRQSKTQARPTLAETVTNRLISPLVVSAFSLSFSSSSSSISCLCRSWSWLSRRCPDDSSGGSLAQNRSFHVTRPSALSASICPPRVYRWNRYSENTQYRVLGTPSSGFMSPLANRFVSEPGP